MKELTRQWSWNSNCNNWYLEILMLFWMLKLKGWNISEPMFLCSAFHIPPQFLSLLLNYWLLQLPKICTMSMCQFFLVLLRITCLILPGNPYTRGLTQYCSSEQCCFLYPNDISPNNILSMTFSNKTTQLIRGETFSFTQHI